MTGQDLPTGGGKAKKDKKKDAKALQPESKNEKKVKEKKPKVEETASGTDTGAGPKKITK